MLDWVDDVLKPYVTTAPVGIIPILFLDSFKVHLLGSIADAIQGLGAKLEIIPPGCTSLVQPIDVGINKPVKANMRKIYTEWLPEQDADAAILSAVGRKGKELRLLRLTSVLISPDWMSPA